MAPFYSNYYEPPAGFSSRLTPLIMQVTMIGIVAGTFFQPAQSIAATVITLLVVGLVFDLAQRAIDFLTNVLMDRLTVNKTYEEGTVEYQWIMAFLTEKKKWPDLSRTSFYPNHTTKLWWNGTWINVTRCEQKDRYYSYSEQNQLPKPYIDLTIYSLRTSAISKLFKEAKQQYNEGRHHNVTVYSPLLGQNMPGIPNYGLNWNEKKEMPARLMDSTSLSIQALTSLVEEARNFFDSETWYNEAGIPWQKRYLLHGPSGSGKRDAVYAVAGKLGRAVYSLSLTSSISDTLLSSALSMIPKGSIFLLENIDIMSESLIDNTLGFQPYSTLPATWSGLFRMLDTTARQEGILLFATATKMESIDDALFQPGRIEKKIKFTHITQEQVGWLFTRFFPSSGSIPQVNNYDHSLDKKSLQLGDLSNEFRACIPENEFTISQLRHYLMKHQYSPESAVANIRDWVKDTQEQNRKRGEEELEAERLRDEVKRIKTEQDTAMMIHPTYTGYPGCVCRTPLTPPIRNEGERHAYTAWSSISPPPAKLEETPEVADLEGRIEDAE